MWVSREETRGTKTAKILHFLKLSLSVIIFEHLGLPMNPQQGFFHALGDEGETSKGSGIKEKIWVWFF